jgi:hypothetical protein
MLDKVLDVEKPCILVAVPSVGVGQGNRAALEHRSNHPNLKSALQAAQTLPANYPSRMIEQNGHTFSVDKDGKLDRW